MLEQVDLTLRTKRSELKARVAELTPRLREVQHHLVDQRVPLALIIEGWDCAGKGECISLLTEILDPRGFKVHVMFEPTVEEALYPFLWRFWIRTPPRGAIAIFDRSWFTRVLTDRVDRVVKKRVWRRAFEEITDFERTLSDAGTHIVKFFLHISKREQRKRFKKFEADPVERWRVRKEDWDHHRKYDQLVEAAEEMFYRTDQHGAPWTLIPAEDIHHAKLRVVEDTLVNMEEALRASKARRAGRPSQSKPKPPRRAPRRGRSRGPSVLDRADLSLRVPKREYERELVRLQTRMRELQFRLFKERAPALAVFEGWDASGKGGAIKRLVARLDPRGYDVHAIAKPTGDELTHHYLWRFWKVIPKGGHLAIFDRSWYGRVLVERVEGFCSEAEWKRAYQEINEFEGQLAASGTVIGKFWVHIDREEQEQRFRSREADPHRRWKITDEDWRNREKWDHYEPAVVEMIERTSTSHAPWTIVEGNDKRHARLRVLRTLCERVEAVLG